MVANVNDGPPIGTLAEEIQSVRRLDATHDLERGKVEGNGSNRVARLLVVIKVIAHAIDEVAAIKRLEKTLVGDEGGLVVTLDGAPSDRRDLSAGRAWEFAFEEGVKVGHGQRVC